MFTPRLIPIKLYCCFPYNFIIKEQWDKTKYINVDVKNQIILQEEKPNILCDLILEQSNINPTEYIVIKSLDEMGDDLFQLINNSKIAYATMPQ